MSERNKPNIFEKSGKKLLATAMAVGALVLSVVERENRPTEPVPKHDTGQLTPEAQNLDQGKGLDQLNNEQIDLNNKSEQTRQQAEADAVLDQAKAEEEAHRRTIESGENPNFNPR